MQKQLLFLMELIWENQNLIFSLANVAYYIYFAF